MTNEIPPGELTEEQRLAVFRDELAATTRHGRRAFRPKVPPRFVIGVAATFAVLGVGGAVLEHFVGHTGTPSAPTTTLAPATTTTLGGSPLPTSTAAFIGLREIGVAAAPPLALTDQSGRPWRLSHARGRVVLVTFYAKNCHDICPVLGTELREALALLDTRGIAVDVAIVNTDPRDVGYAANPAALYVPGLAGRAGVTFLTGSLRQLNAAWTRFGVSVQVGAAPTEIAHNDVLYFVDPRGRLRALAVPFGNESRRAVFTLPAREELRFAQGIASEAGSLAR
ncbi:MAG: SCO family protein [Acidimicrobiales bacterium]